MKVLQAVAFTLSCGLALPQAVAAQGQAVLEDAWVRALPPTQTNTAAYMTVRNPGSEPLTISGGSTALAERVELHDTAEVDGMLRMRQQESVTVPAGGSVDFAPGGLHLMLLGLERMPAAGEVLELCLDIDGESVCTEAETRRTPAGSGHDHQHHQ
ncbi:copper chaperone PCu(A)C [Haliea sp. E1-2-M8]|uniref:copper chaperone PCu(A)C n=1 Tax=Haliea sp. E1-2-M8 TaxID=3064706 RepID=UPI00271B4704|nr:copper chaperone PCu(A)C [Haliea sp. E1-2-M8]MDO8863867.1 copper chaperone PCu(A)C [Haliea sp. E1-2-M8]